MFGRRPFAVAGPAAWNSLPDYLQDPTRSVDSFRRDLKTLFSRSTSLHSVLGDSRLCAIQIYY